MAESVGSSSEYRLLSLRIVRAPSATALMRKALYDPIHDGHVFMGSSEVRRQLYIGVDKLVFEDVSVYISFTSPSFNITSCGLVGI